MDLKTVLDRLNDFDGEVAAEEARMFGTPGQAANDLVRSPKFQEIVKLLHAEPMFVEPTLLFLQEKQQKVAMAKLQALYTPEQLDALIKRAQEQQGQA